MVFRIFALSYHTAGSRTLYESFITVTSVPKTGTQLESQAVPTALSRVLVPLLTHLDLKLAK